MVNEPSALGTGHTSGAFASGSSQNRQLPASCVETGVGSLSSVSLTARLPASL
jgi:hypothetical protein